MIRAAFILLLVQGVLCGSILAEQVCNTEQFPLSSPSERFTDNEDGTITDDVSQLMWMRCSAGQEWMDGACIGEAQRYDWEAAATVAERLGSDGEQFFNDWRVPSLRELALIVERECENPRINLEAFPNTPAGFYWSGSLRPGEGFDTFAYALSFGPDGVRHLAKQERHYVRLVRTAP
jgi:hypothetical protein